jgi:hypothetical protein
MSSELASLGRPWFVTVTALWTSAVGYDELQSLLNGPHGFRESLAAQQWVVPEARWHSTLFAVIRANGALESASCETQIVDVLAELAATPELLRMLQDAFVPFELEAHTLSCFDSTTSVQFRSVDGKLARFRTSLFEILGEPVAALCSAWNSRPAARAWTKRHGLPVLESTVTDPLKNSGDHAFGAVARSAIRPSTNTLRWSRELPLVRLRFDSVLLAPSDDALCNPRAIDDSIALRG